MNEAIANLFILVLQVPATGRSCGALERRFALALLAGRPLHLAARKGFSTPTDFVSARLRLLKEGHKTQCNAPNIVVCPPEGHDARPPTDRRESS